MSAISGRQNQKKQGLSVEQSKIRPKLTPEQRKTMTMDEKKEYSAQRLKEYRNAYSDLYMSKVLNYEPKSVKIEKEIAYKFYKEYLAKQVATLV